MRLASLRFVFDPEWTRHAAGVCLRDYCRHSAGMLHFTSAMREGGKKKSPDKHVASGRLTHRLPDQEEITREDF